MLILFIMPLICPGEGGGGLFFVGDLHLQIIAIISPKASVEKKKKFLFIIIFGGDDLHLQLLKSFPWKHQSSKLLDSLTARGVCNY